MTRLAYAAAFTVGAVGAGVFWWRVGPRVSAWVLR